MSNTETIEVDPSELSDEVRDDLTDELDINSEFAEEYAEELKINELVDKDPDKKSFVDSFTEKLKSGYSSVAGYFNTNTIYAEIVDISVTDNDYIVLEFSHPNLVRNATCKKSPDDRTLSNIMEYHDVNDASELVNKKVPIFNPEDLSDTFTDTYITFPNNTSLSGKIRYKIFCAIKNIEIKMPLTNQDPVDLVLGGILYNLIGLALGTAISGGIVEIIGVSTAQNLPSIMTFAILLPFIIALFFNFVSGVYLVSRFILFTLSKLFKSDFENLALDKFQ